MRFIISEDEVNQRIDKALSVLCKELSRARVQGLIKAGDVLVDGLVCTDVSRKLKTGERVDIEIPPPVSAQPKPENIPLDVVYEDTDVLVLNKPAGLVVHPGAGNPDGTLVNALLYHCGDELSGVGGVIRPGIVHRLDKETSGLMVVAKNDRAHQGLSQQLEKRDLKRVYQALVLGEVMPPKGMVDQPIGRHVRNRLKMAVNSKTGRLAKTHYKVLESYRNAVSLLECTLESGRTHQIRVHMGFLKHPIIGDPLYGPQPTALKSSLKSAGYEDKAIGQIVTFPRQALHACALSFAHPRTRERLSFDSLPPRDIANLLKLIKK